MFKKKERKGREIQHKQRNKLETQKIQINEKKIGKLPENEFGMMIVKVVKSLGKKWRKCKIQLTKT